MVGGTGPTGPHIVAGLLERGFDVTIFHRGTHEPADLPDVRHIHGDPHFAETIESSVGAGEYDVVLASYGRTTLLAESFVGRVGHFISIGGTPRYAGFNEPRRCAPSGLALPTGEDAPTALTVAADESPAIGFAHRIVRTEEAVFAAHPDATHLVYPIVYGPRTVWPWEWSVIKRVRDGRAPAAHRRRGSRCALQGGRRGGQVCRALSSRSSSSTCPRASLRRACDGWNQATRSISGKLWIRPDRGGHCISKVLLTAFAGSTSPSTA